VIVLAVQESFSAFLMNNESRSCQRFSFLRYHNARYAALARI
jgi:hypothetical protein